MRSRSKFGSHVVRGRAAGSLRAADASTLAAMIAPMRGGAAGVRLGDASGARACQRCGTALADEALFCDECIAVLSEQAKKTNQQQIEILRRELERRRRGNRE